MQNLFEYFSFAGKETALFLISMIPLIELRGSIPFGAAMGMDWYRVFIIAVIGNILPVPFIILLTRPFFAWLKRTRLFSGFIHKYEAKLMKKARKSVKYSMIGLLLFVAIPFPGTGAWSGSFIAALLDLRLKNALISIVSGVLIAGVIMTLGSYGLLGVVRIISLS